jgi:hypothetical protein
MRSHLQTSSASTAEAIRSEPASRRSWRALREAPALRGRRRHSVHRRLAFASLVLASVTAPIGCGGGNGNGSTPTTGSITITSVETPPQPEGDVPLTVHFGRADLSTTKVTLELSANGAGFVGAHVSVGAVLAGSASSAGDAGTMAVIWHSLQDVSLHGKASVKLRLTPSDVHGNGPAFTVALTISNLRSAARRVNYPLFSYGGWEAAAIMSAKRHDLVVIHPNGDGVNRALVQEIQKGMDPNDPSDDVIVLGYVSAGEDDRVSGLTDAQAHADARFHGDGTGPRVDPRGPTPNGGPLSGIPVLGKASPGGSGWASYYLDDDSVAIDGKGDGIPDRNSTFGGYFVNAGDPSWFQVVDKMTVDGADGVAGLAEVLTTTTGRGLGCDGVFLDTIDTVAPNEWTSPGNADFTQFEWTAPGMSAFVERAHSTYPDSLVLQNRGDFFFDPELEHFAYTTRGAIDFFLFESYRLNSSSTDGIDPGFFADNQYDIMPKLVAESQRPDGFRILSIGYVEGTGTTDAAATLQGQGTVALDTLLEDIRVTERIAGFRHYLTNADLTLTNTFVRDHADLTDIDPPVWSSVWNTRVDAAGLPAPPSPRVGLQKVTPGQGQVTVQWDVALDLNHVSYALYYSRAPLELDADPTLTGATRVVLTPRPPAAYGSAFSAASLPFEATVTNLESGATYYFVLRAFDTQGNEEKNTVSLSTTLP